MPERDDRPQPRRRCSSPTSPARSIPRATAVFIGRERHVENARAGYLPYPAAGDPDARLPLHHQLPARPLAAGRPVSPRRRQPAERRGAHRGHARARLPTRTPARPRPGWSACATTRSGSAYYELAYGKRPREELYDLKSDPHQVKNVAADPAYAAEPRRTSSGAGPGAIAPAASRSIRTCRACSLTSFAWARTVSERATCGG